VIELLESTAFGAAVVFGFRHGFDWDHIAALTDLTGSQTSSSRRSMWLATLYALGHAVMVLVLGCAAILFAEQVPESVDLVMERLVGVSLLALGVWMAWTAVRTRAAPPLRSRWMLLIDAARRTAGRRRAETVVIEHSHPHDHDHLHEHDHDHDELVADDPAARPGTTTVAVQHAHRHRHVAVAPRDPFVRYGSWSSFGVGLLHGVGAETPTQVLVFAAAAHASGRPTSVALLGCFVVGLLVSNTLVAAASTFGFRGVLASRVVSSALAAVTAGFSLVVGSLLLFGEASVLPTMLG
jgi:ABC-type nickel/cobalt efflux system permease component RcnA